MSETFSLKERIEYAKVVNRARKDPIWFIKDILGWKSIWPKQEEIVRTFYQSKYDPSLQEYKELAWISGQRSGKTATIAHLCAYEFHELISLDDPQTYFGLMPNQPLAVSCIAAGKEQALDGVFSIMANAIESSEWMNQWYDLSSKEGRIDYFKKHIFVQIKAARADTGAGYTSGCVAFDELDLFQKNTESKISAENVFRKMVNSTMTLGNRGRIFSISSLDNVDGMMSRVYYDALQKQNAVAYNLKTWEVNPKSEVSEDRLREEYKYNMDAFHKYFANNPEASSGVLFPGLINFDRNIVNIFEPLEDQTIPDSTYSHYHVMAVDPAHRNDSFGLSTAYRYGNDLIVDGVTKFTKKKGEEPYIKPSDIEKFVLSWVEPLNIETFIYDVDLILGLVEILERDYGITCIKHRADEEAYGRWVSANDGLSDFNLHLVYNESLQREAKQLMKSKTQGRGQLKIDHPFMGAKDCSDTVANCIWYLANRDSTITWKPVSHLATMNM